MAKLTLCVLHAFVCEWLARSHYPILRMSAKESDGDPLARVLVRIGYILHAYAWVLARFSYPFDVRSPFAAPIVIMVDL